ncbi:E3 ubiquitin-protein ligase MYCBP2-like isoform X2 [Mya arenaria]|uniref:E3 ubiquitin-protein ligase MYCBP2-like isoform X2 n=1 Tax=Mya arenaria TaxID=6604 RepID=UPI0022E02E60|nr:E3 ubiquitin-protein ligase MYCBP2-like isoform X2 [Mya arenaria]
MDVILHEGKLANIEADVIVNSANQRLALKHGRISASILKTSGDGLQEECSRLYPNGIHFGGVAATNGHGLKCQRVYHVALPDWGTHFLDPQQILCDVVSNCLNQADKEKMTSIAFPTLGCGFLNYPADIVMESISSCVSKFETEHKQTTLTKVIIVVFNKGGDWRNIKQAFLRSQKRTRHTKDANRQTGKAVPDMLSTCYRLKSSNACGKNLQCGHACTGYKDEAVCPPCLQAACASRAVGLSQTADDDCAICYTEALRDAPVIQAQISHTKLAPILAPLEALLEDVKRKALMRLAYEEQDKADHQNPELYAMEKYSYYQCFKCKKAYFGGAAQCEGAAADKEIQEEELVCPPCSDPQRVQQCVKHGVDFIEYKCRYCCSVASFFCFGTTHFCNLCHNMPHNMAALQPLPRCPAAPQGKQLQGDCPLGIKHPATGEEFCLGCGLCSNLQEF